MRRTLSVGAAVLAAGLVAAAPAGAQGRSHGRGRVTIPPGQRPPAGLCRIWIDGVPPGRQPGVTDCGYAYAHVPANGRVIYGGRATDRSDVRNRQYAPYYYGAPRQGDSNGNYIQRIRDRLNTTRAQQQPRGEQSVYTVRGERDVPSARPGDDDRSERKGKHEKEHGHGRGHDNDND